MDLTGYEKIENGRNIGRAPKDIITINKTGWIGFGKAIVKYHPDIVNKRIDIYIKQLSEFNYEVVCKFCTNGEHKVLSQDSIGVTCKGLVSRHPNVCGIYKITAAQREGEDLFFICSKQC